MAPRKKRTDCILTAEILSHKQLLLSQEESISFILASSMFVLVQLCSKQFRFLQAYYQDTTPVQQTEEWRTWILLTVSIFSVLSPPGGEITRQWKLDCWSSNTGQTSKIREHLKGREMYTISIYLKFDILFC